MSRYWSLRELYLTRLREFYRQPARIFWVYGFPMVLAVGIGLAFRNQPVETITVSAFDHSGVVPRNPIQTIKGATGLPDLKIEALTEADAMNRLKTGKTPLVVETTTSGETVYHFDPTRPEARAARAATDDALERQAGRVDKFTPKVKIVDEPGSRYIDFLIPGLIGQNTMGGGLWGVGFLIVNFRSGKLLKRFLATPMPRHHFLMAILGARLTFLIPDVGVMLLLGKLGFQMPIRGSLWLIALIEVVGALAFAGIGLLIASRARTTETVSGLMNLVMLPMWIFSGLFFSADRFPYPMKYFVQALPLTQLLNALRLVILDGATLTHTTILFSLAGLTAWAVGTFWVALRIFRWT